MREIKFRGMDLQGRWFYGNLAILPNDLRSTGNKAGHYISNAAGAPFAYAVRPETVGQYTGLKDRNGVEIYDGDLWIARPFGIPYEIRWHETGWYLFRHNTKLYDNADGLANGEVIGNAWENGGLLNESQKTNAD